MVSVPLTPLMLQVRAGLLSQLLEKLTLPLAAVAGVKWAAEGQGPAVLTPNPRLGQLWALGSGLCSTTAHLGAAGGLIGMVS